MDAHKGAISVESVVNKGTKFGITIPHARDLHSGEGPKTIPIEVSYNWKNKVILVVDDNESNYLFFESCIDKTQAQLLWAKDGMEAIQLCKNNPLIDLVLMDIQLPNLNGYEATIEIKKIRKDLPVLAQTAFAMNGEDENCFIAGCDAYISLPVQPKLLLKEIDRFLK